MNALSFQTTLKKRPTINRSLFASLKDAALGKAYNLSIVFIGPKKMRSLNRTLRGIDKTTDILSFGLTKNSGEIYLDLEYAAKKAKEFGKTPDIYTKFLFVHGLLHLKGMDHGSRMESEEKKLCRKFGISW